MLNFAFTEEQEQLRKTLREFAQKELLPNYTKWDREKTFPLETWKKMGQLGLTGLRVHSEYGGIGADCITTGIAAEEVGKGDFNAAYAVMLNGLIGEILQAHATEHVKKTWLQPMAEGNRLLAIAITEPGAGSDAARIKTRAVRKGDEYVISGEKSGISLARVAHAFLIFAKTDPDAGARGVSVFLVPRNSDGIEIQGYEDMGNVPIGRGSVFLDQVRVPVEYRIGAENQGFYQIMNGFDLSRVLIALQCIGAAEQTLTETMEHVKERHAFGQPLAKFEGVSFPIAETHTWLEMARWLCYRTLWLRDQGLSHTKEAAMCKWIGPSIAAKAIHECLLLNGHYGYTKEMPIEQRLRDVIGLEIGDGTAQIQKIIIARELLGKEFKPY
ncbi:MAG: cyclohexanecarboxyl-CoA dehydrogenase [Bacillus thermozeamaize]|uniref:Cyclohexanecarboxyl-CoA dehydrogenase n=1 Tax=Bacillus thermozeamaize TaxID=230954 RepID=A0A1Y3PYE7_9BACI|nr:MAG: cyclohexanecarboxyl-CoA dehydrogenase [Bacillus thermozeamaize]